ncbi:MAG TPA: cytochrome c-type biogenesis protein [Rhizomicrobium sp.]|nr:cytochrome c-type biogenesis protein [Rhizomicrobium sp.]
MRKFLCLFLFLSNVALAAPAPDSLPNPAQEAHARLLQKEFRCLVCQGESIDESNAPLAADLRRLIREHIVRGESDEQIRRYLVSRYGEFILMKPRVEPATYALWLAPLLVFLTAAGIAGIIVVRARNRAASVSGLE